jgi:hypothetical protein
MTLKRPSIKILSTLVIVIAFVFSYCKNSADKIVDEGIIEFDVISVDPDHPWAGMIPSTATLKFKDDKFLLEMSTMGMFTTSFICNQDNKTLTQMVKFLDIKQACIEKEEEIKKENSDYKIKWEECKETKVIAGYKCKKVNVVMVEHPEVTFEAYYTKEMGAENVNDLSPYNGIKGMLMQYRLKKMGLELQFTAKSVKQAEVTDNVFEIPAYFKIVPKTEIEKIFQQF